jgi:hypothetical protein
MYSQQIVPSNSDKGGLLNFIQMIINEIEAGNTREALLKAVDLKDDILGCKFSWIDPDTLPVCVDEPDEPAQVTALISANEENKNIAYFRNSYYI